MNFSEMRQEAEKIARKHRNRLKKDGSKFITGEAPLLAFDDRGRLDERLVYIPTADGQSGCTLSELSKKMLDQAIAEVKEAVEKNPELKKDEVGISLYGRYRGYESPRSFMDDEFESDEEEYDIVIWTLKEGIVCREDV